MEQTPPNIMIRAFDVGSSTMMWSGDHGCPTPTGTLDSLGGLLTRVSSRFQGEGVLILADDAVTALGMPEDITRGASDPGYATVPDGQITWRSTGLHGWTTFSSPGRPTVHMVPRSYLRETRSPLVAPHPMDTIHNLTTWHNRTGVSWRGEPGSAGLAVIRHHTKSVMRQQWMKPSVVGPCEESSEWVEGAFEAVFNPSDWRGPSKPNERYAHQYDGRRAGLAAMNTVEVCPGYLTHHHNGIRFDKALAGWWLCEMPVWNVRELPNPAGPVYHTMKWLTTPTVALLMSLAEEGLTDGPIIREAWVGPGRRLYRKAAETLNTTWKVSADRGEESIAEAVKAAYSEAHGRMNSTVASSWFYRPDHYHAINAMKRANGFRFMLRTYRTTKRWPIAVDDDAIWYTSAEADGKKAAPETMKFGDELGRWQHKKTRERRGNRA